MDAIKFTLGNLANRLKSGEIQLPDFQRDWIWNDDQIKSLLESVIRGFPINSILLLACNAADTKFAFRPIQGVENTDAKPQYLILDGQQRLTSLFGALFSDKPVETFKGKKLFYYVDMEKAIESIKNSAEVEDMIISVPENRKTKTLDLSTSTDEYANAMFPLNKIFNGTRQWLRAYEKHHQDSLFEKIADDFDAELINKVSSYEIIAIELEKDTPLAAVCKIFEKVNISGEKLGVFELLTAIFAVRVDKEGKRPLQERRHFETRL